MSGRRKHIQITYFTASFNRGDKLHRVFDSLRRQTVQYENSRPLFEWIVVDDGSADDTPAVLRAMQRRASFPIRVLHQSNRGKHTAINRGLKEAGGELFVIIDSDDEFAPETSEVILRHWRGLTPAQRNKIFGISFLVRDARSDRIIGVPHEDAPVITEESSLEYRLRTGRYQYEGWSAMRTEVLRRFPFPEPSGIRFIPEAFVWDRMERQYAVLATNDVLRTAWFEPDGFTGSRAKNFRVHARGFVLFYSSSLNWNRDLHLRLDRIRYIKTVLQLARCAWHGGIGPIAISKQLTNLADRFLIFPAFAAGLLLAGWDRLKEKRQDPLERPAKEPAGPASGSGTDDDERFFARHERAGDARALKVR